MLWVKQGARLSQSWAERHPLHPCSPLALFPAEFSEDTPSSRGQRVAVARGPVALSCQRKLRDSEPDQTTDQVLGLQQLPLGPGERLERDQDSLRTLDNPPVPQSHPNSPLGVEGKGLNLLP